MTTQLPPLLDHYLAEFARVENDLPGATQPWVSELRKSALKRFVSAGFPTARMESWKYSDTRPLQKNPFELASGVPVSQSQVTDACPAELDCYRIVFVNGRLSEEHSQLSGLPEGLVLNTLSIDLGVDNKLADHLNVSVNGHGHALSDLNLAFAADGAVIHIEDNTELDKPIYLLFLTSSQDDAQMVQVRNLINVGRNASATVIEHYGSVEGEQSTYFTGSILEVELAEGARLKRCRIQNEGDKAFQVGATHAELSRNSFLHNHSVDLGGRWVRHDTVINLKAPGAEVHLDGLYVPTGRQHIDNQTRIDHSSPHCISREDYKGILDGNSRGVFNGKIVVHEDAQQTDSEQSSAALLLSGKAEVDAKPELEIYADDVKCKHGATVGQLDEQAIFYLQSRGLDPDAARNLLTYSFADELIQRVGIEPLRKLIETGLLARLPNAEQLRELL